MSKNIESILDFGEFSKKKRVNSKRKGSTFERKIAKMLNERFDTKEFSRTPGSGAFATSHRNLPEHLRIQGDLITPSNFPFVVECKTVMTYNLMIYLNTRVIFMTSSDKHRAMLRAPTKNGASYTKKLDGWLWWS